MNFWKIHERTITNKSSPTSAPPYFGHNASMAQIQGAGLPVSVNKMDQRFSNLFLESAHLSTDKSAEAKSESSKVKRMLGRLFKTSPGDNKKSPTKEKPAPEQHIEDLWNTVISLTKSPEKKPSVLRRTKKALSLPAPKLQLEPEIKPTNEPITILPPSDPFPTYTRKDIFYKGKGKPLASSRDSKFSSISSLPSLHSLNLSISHSPANSTPSSATTLSSTHVVLTRTEFSHLQSLLRRATRRLQQQEHLVSNLANNLLHIFARKELSIQNAKRMRKSEQQNMLQTIFRTKEHCGRLFLRKSAHLQHSFTILSKLRTMIEDAEKEAVLAIPKACSSRQASEGVRFVVSRETAVDFVAEMGRDMELQRGLDREVRRTVLERTREGRWVSNMSEGIMMVRFVEFLEGRGRVLEESYDKLGVVVKGIDEVVREKEGSLMSITVVAEVFA